jgi:hypothetical protein
MGQMLGKGKQGAMQKAVRSALFGEVFITANSRALESARGLAQSKTLTRGNAHHVLQQFWTAPVLRGFSATLEFI